MASLDEQILRTAKEIVVKFIETGRVSPTGFHDFFRSVYTTVDSAAKGIPSESAPPGEEGEG